MIHRPPIYTHFHYTTLFQSKGNVTVNYQGKKLFNDEMAFTQFGYTEVLVDGLFDKKVNTRVIFNSTTGGILKIDKD